jgi:hypothetical protein
MVRWLDGSVVRPAPDAEDVNKFATGRSLALCLIGLIMIRLAFRDAGQLRMVPPKRKRIG